MADAVQITEDDVRRLAKMLGLLGSSQVGERAAAALKAHEWVQSRGLAWEELLIPPDLGAVVVTVGGQAPPPQASVYTPMPPWAALCAQFLLNFAHLARGTRELGFLQSQVDRAQTYGLSARLSEKQEAWLRDILGRAGLTW